MDARRGGDDSSGLDRDQNPDTPAVAPLPSPSPKELLEYIAAMLQELKTMSEHTNCSALAGLIERAYQEAVRRSRAGH